MSHEIEQHDKLVLHKTAAWHGLGTIVQDAKTALETLPAAPGDWEVEQWPLAATNGEGTRLALDNYVLNVRADVKRPLGIVARGYRPIQNRELAAFCDALVEQGDKIKVESAGSIRNGAKVWFLLKGESFSVRGKDEVTPYILASNGHDGGTALRVTPTTVRVVCSNTLHMVIPNKETEGRATSYTRPAFVAHHTATIMERVEEAKRALKLYGKAEEATREVIDSLAAKDLTNQQVKQFFLQCWVRDYGPIPTNVTNAVEENRKLKAMAGLRQMFKTFESELGLAGPTAWNAANAVTGFGQNLRTRRGKDAGKLVERRQAEKLFGVEADRAHSTLLAALAL